MDAKTAVDRVGVGKKRDVNARFLSMAIFETGNDSYRFKANSEKAMKRRNETAALTASKTGQHNDWTGQISVATPTVARPVLIYSQ